MTASVASCNSKEEESIGNKQQQQVEEKFDAEGNIRQLEGASYEIIGQCADQTDGLLKLFIETLPLSEPFDRIYQAMGEARADAA